MAAPLTYALALFAGGCVSGPGLLAGREDTEEAEERDTAGVDDTDTDTAATDTDTDTDTAGTDTDEATPVAGFPTNLYPGANVVVIFVDTLRADRLRAYGHTRDTLPTVGGEPWVTVHGLYAASSWTLPTTAAALTGLDPHHHGLIAFADTDIGAAEPITAPTLAGHLRGAGYASGLFSGNGIVSPTVGIGLDFDTVSTRKNTEGARDAAGQLPDTLAWIDSLSPGVPFFAWVQPMDMHGPYSPEAEDIGTWSDAELMFPLGGEWQDQERAMDVAYATDPSRVREQVRDVYDEQLLGVDRALRTFLDALDARGLRENTIVILAADHGETLDDYGDGAFGHSGSLRYELLNVPFLMLLPGLSAASYECGSSSSDLTPTLLTFLGVPVPAGLDGRSLQRGCRDWKRAAYWERGSALAHLSVADSDFHLIRNCAASREEFREVRNGAYGVPTVEPRSVPRAAQQREEVGYYADEIATAYEGTACNGPSSALTE